ncbi:orotidine 5'-phosphate decarboxylase / HUMPS family protein [Chroococcidiopsis sp. CCMEE 29]|uniref:orotidine 5'-phosphate decarboxylase / HUMPS family protein n=1 Tax=Chroococcidiopsis sp. CCMEE 29 TaxID=155894 RepID=UPI002020867F|nr:orotidine 5'-phosphate decarboxylase / HUMPS family protein [Chroococcidiopsis sp. CCMEE 29]
MKPYLWIAYDYTSTSQCLAMLDTILEKHPERDIIHEIGRPTLLHAALEGFPIVSEFRKRLNNNQMLVVDFKGYDVPYIAEGQYYYAAGTDLVTVMAAAPNEAIQEAIDGANIEQKRVAFDLMTCQDDDWKVKRAQELADLGASLVSCHTGWSEQAAGKNPYVLIGKVCQQLKYTSTQVIPMGGIKPSNIKDLKAYVEQIFAIAVGSAITRSNDPNLAIAQFQLEMNQLNSRPLSNAPWAAIER